MSKIKILYVEDEIFLGKIVKESLESRGYEVAWIDDGDKVMKAFETLNPHICLLDIMLPNKDGFEIGDEIRALNVGIPIIYLTAKSQTSDVVKGFSSGGNDYIKKPFSVEELIVRIDNLLAITNASTSISIKGNLKTPKVEDDLLIGAYTFNPVTLELSMGEEIKKLSHRETQLIKILCENKNQPIDRRDILNKVWGDDHYFNSRNLDVYIRKLRDYLEADPNVQIITLKGLGYQFVVK